MQGVGGCGRPSAPEVGNFGYVELEILNTESGVGLPQDPEVEEDRVVGRCGSDAELRDDPNRVRGWWVCAEFMDRVQVDEALELPVLIADGHPKFELASRSGGEGCKVKHVIILEGGVDQVEKLRGGRVEKGLDGGA